MENKGYTPETLGDLKFSIPLYQRLFEWEENQIRQLLEDLHAEFENDENSPYYIGMFTVYQEKDKNQVYSLVDGQQRFTVLNLMGIAFDSSNWNKFLKVSEECRLSFFAREKDKAYLKSKIDKTQSVNPINQKMETGIEVISKFLRQTFQDEQKRSEFVNYVYRCATFFISELPYSYQSHDLNKYFEAMNAAGKGLENHEILKVNLLKKIGDQKDFYTKLWNSVSMMDRRIIEQSDNEKIKDYQSRILQALNLFGSSKELLRYCGESAPSDKTDGKKYLKDITPSPTNPKSKEVKTKDERSILNFSEFLLLVLRLQLQDDDIDKKGDFFNTNKLLETFEKYLKEVRVAEYFDNLLKFRILFDNFVLRIGADEQEGNSYFINFTDEDEVKEDNRRLEQYQAMLNVSTTAHLWLRPLLKYLVQNPMGQSSTSILNELKRLDDDRHNIENLTFKYGEIDRYWFWRLDYYLWDNREKYFLQDKSDQKTTLGIAGKYIFRANRSIEHVSPQTTKNGDIRRIEDGKVHWFGNLVMISSGQNSSLQNQPFEVKKAHVKSFYGGKTGSIESLKMLKLYEFEEWDDANLEKHQIEMIKILIDSFPQEYEAVRTSLAKQLSEIHKSEVSLLS